MTPSTEVIVVGLGAMGSATLYHLARRGVRAIGFDRFAPPHTLGSTHGLSRIIREAYYEHPLYVPLVRRAYALWADLERSTRRRLFQQTGGLMIGPRDGVLVAGALKSATEHGLAHELLDAATVRGRFPILAVPDDNVALLEPRAGVLDPEACVDAHLTLARAAGASVRVDEPVDDWRVDAQGVHVTSGRGEYRAARLAICAGPWTPALLDDAAILLTVERQVMHWFTPQRDAEEFASDRCPVVMWEHERDRLFYTLPDSGAGFKAAIHHEGERTDADRVRRTVDARDVEPVRALLRRYIPAADSPPLRSAVCLYTNTPDQHFLIDAHPRHDEVLIVSACSGHGFKFASAVGELATDLLTGTAADFDLSLFRRRG